MRNLNKPTITIIGAGALARVLVLSLHTARYEVREIIARRPATSQRRAQKLAKLCNTHAAMVHSAKLDSDVIWMCVPDDAVAEVARELAKRKDIEWRNKSVVHSSGALPASVLMPLQERGASVASAHPMNTFVETSAPTLKGVPFALEGDNRSVRVVESVVRKLGGEAFRIHAESKPLYHAMGAFASPLYVSLIAAAEEVGHKAGFKTPRKVMAHILRQTTENIIWQGTAGAFSGPMKRGDIATLRKHLEVLRSLPEAIEIYKVLCKNAIHHLPVKNRAALLKLFI